MAALVFAIVMASPLSAGAATAPPTTAPPTTAPPATVPMPEAKAYVLVDLGTGNVLAGYNEHLRLPPASLTKILTALIAVTYLPATAGVPGTKQSAAAYPDDVGIEPGVSWPLPQVLQSLLVMSANDAAYALAQRISGSLTAFGPVMAQSAAQIGMSDDPVYHDPAGLDGTEGVGGGNLVSARDLAIAGRDLLRVPELAAIVRERSYSFVDPTGARKYLQSTNLDFLVDEPGAIGVKTGLTDRAGFCVMGAATRDGRTMLAVVMNGYNSSQTAIDLINQGFATPVAAEPTYDHLPAFALPHPPAQQKAAAAGRARTAAGRLPAASNAPRAGSTGSASRGQRLSPSHRAGGQRPSEPHAAKPAAGGLAAVASTWPGKLLLLVTALAVASAVGDIIRARALHLRRSTPLAGRSRTTAWVTTLGGNRRHRDELVASYTRHQRR